jgi:hypothetical protein
VQSEQFPGRGERKLRLRDIEQDGVAMSS